jgi:hypothetical protein
LAQERVVFTQDDNLLALAAAGAQHPRKMERVVLGGVELAAQGIARGLLPK